MSIKEKAATPPRSAFIRATVLYFDPRRGSGRARSADGKLLRIPLQAVKDAQLFTLDEDQEILVLLDEVDPRRIETLRIAATEA